MIVWPMDKWRVDAGFLDPNYPAWRRSAGLPPDEHPGVDLNVPGTSGDGDLGYPVRAMAEGRVVHVGRHRVWGTIVLIEHPTVAQALGYGYLASQYAHLLWAAVEEGQWVPAGWAIGSIGKGDPARPFLAHLHFELRTTRLPPDHWPKTKEAIQRAYTDPVAFLRQHGDNTIRYTRNALILYDRHGRWSIPGTVVLNVNDPNIAHVRISGSFRDALGK